MRTSTGMDGNRPDTSGILAVVTVLLLASGASSAIATSPQAPRPTWQQDNLLDLPGIAGAPEKGSPMLDSRLAQLTEIERRDGLVAARRFARDNAIPVDADGRVHVLIHENAARQIGREPTASVEDPEQRVGRTTPGEEALFGLLEQSIAAEVTRLDGDVRGRVGNLVDASVPIRNLRSLDPGVGFRWIAAPPVAKPSVVSEGVSVIRAELLQSSTVDYQPPDGPLRIGVIDLGFLGYQELIGSELPAATTAQSFSAGGIDGNGLDLLDQVHGTACAEIAYDVAPNAELFLANFNTISDNDQAFDWMIEQGVDVISYSIGWFNAGPGDGQGPINAAAQRAIDAGIQVVASAGNEARTHWQGAFVDNDNDRLHNFATDDESNAVFLNAGETLTVFLNWDDWFLSDQDYDLYILDDQGEVVAFSIGAQTGFQNPAEAAGFTAEESGTYHVLIQRFAASRAVFLEMFFFVDREMQYIVPAGSLTIPADSPDVVTVGATYWGDDVIEAFSSLGPTSDGRTKPDLSAPDGVATASYGSLGLDFFGTSASTPHVAGAIALMKSRFGVFTLDQIRDILYGRALDQGVAGPDNTYGRGRLDLIGQ